LRTVALLRLLPFELAGETVKRLEAKLLRANARRIGILSGDSAALGIALRPVVLRPNLSIGLPFSDYWKDSSTLLSEKNLSHICDFLIM
jgi:hypothetical protein